MSGFLANELKHRPSAPGDSVVLTPTQHAASAARVLLAAGAYCSEIVWLIERDTESWSTLLIIMLVLSVFAMFDSLYTFFYQFSGDAEHDDSDMWSSPKDRYAYYWMTGEFGHCALLSLPAVLALYNEVCLHVCVRVHVCVCVCLSMYNSSA
jgi:hypothetical protein